MKIDCAWKPKMIKDLAYGVLFYHKGHFYILTDTSPSKDMLYCLEIESGTLIAFIEQIEVLEIKNATLKIGGYYK